MRFTNLEDFRRMLDEQPIFLNDDSVISKGILNTSEDKIEYTIHLGWNPLVANLCDRLWGDFNIALMEHIEKLGNSGQNTDSLLSDAQLEDFHWKWLAKTYHYHNDCYEWFFLISDNEPQAACLIYHPKKSAADAKEIFYIEYIAVAPWNRHNILAERRLKGLGSLLIKIIQDYAVNNLGLSEGFSLHALPKAIPFYENKIGMTAFPSHDKDGLRFFEWIAPLKSAGA